VKTYFDFYNAVWLCVVSIYNIMTTGHMVRFKLAAYICLFQQTPDARTPPYFHRHPINIIHLSTVTGFFPNYRFVQFRCKGALTGRKRCSLQH